MCWSVSVPCSEEIRSLQAFRKRVACFGNGLRALGFKAESLGERQRDAAKSKPSWSTTPTLSALLSSSAHCRVGHWREPWVWATQKLVPMKHPKESWSGVGWDTQFSDRGWCGRLKQNGTECCQARVSPGGRTKLNPQTDGDLESLRAGCADHLGARGQARSLSVLCGCMYKPSDSISGGPGGELSGFPGKEGSGPAGLGAILRA